MSRIDWAVAEVKYVTKPEASYDWIAKLFNVDKTTVGSIEQQEEVFRNLLVTPAITNKKIIFIKVVSMDT